MIQRIQSVYFLAIAILTAVVIFLPVAELSKAGINYLLDFKQIDSVVALSVKAVSIVIPIISLITLFLFKKRILQLKLGTINTFLIIGYYLLLALTIYIAVKNGFDYKLQFVVILPAIAIILSLLALRAIKKDEALIKSLDRMR